MEPKIGPTKKLFFKKIAKTNYPLGFFPKIVVSHIGRIFLDWQIGSIPTKSEEMTGKPGLAREGTVRQGKIGPDEVMGIGQISFVTKSTG